MTPLAFIPAMLLYPWEEIEEDLPQQQALTDYMREGERAQVQWVGNPVGFGFGGEPSQDAAMMMFEGLAGNGERLAREAQGGRDRFHVLDREGPFDPVCARRRRDAREDRPGSDACDRADDGGRGA